MTNISRITFSRQSLRNISITMSKTCSSSSESGVQYLELDCQENEKPRSIAYEKIGGTKKFGIVYIPGFMSGKDGAKTTKLKEYCKKYEFPYVRYDPSVIGDSNKSLLRKDVRFSHWIGDAEAVITKLTDGPQIVVGSSMGAWISIILAMKYPDKFAALLLIAPGLNFSDRIRTSYSKLVSPELLTRLDNGETIEFDAGYGDVPLSWKFLDNFKTHNVDLSNPVKIDCPVRIKHGLKDDTVPYEEALVLLQALTSKDADLHYIKEGDHTLSTDENLESHWNTIQELYLKLTDIPLLKETQDRH